MFSVKKPFIILVLIVLLVFTGYVHHTLTQNSLLKASSDYEKYEEARLADENLDKDQVDLEGVDVVDSNDSDVHQVIKDSNKSLDELTSKEVISKTYFVEQRLSRDRLRAGLIDALNEIVENEKSDTTTIAEAQKRIMEVGKVNEKELIIESLIKAKGFEDALVLISDSNAKVIVSKPDLNEQDMVKILNIVIEETGFDSTNINIMKNN